MADPKVGQVVLIVDDDMPRSLWKMGRITELIPSADGKVRTANVKTTERRILQRATRHLYPLELGEVTQEGNEITKEKGIERPEEERPEPTQKYQLRDRTRRVKKRDKDFIYDEDEEVELEKHNSYCAQRVSGGKSPVTCQTTKSNKPHRPFPTKIATFITLLSLLVTMNVAPILSYSGIMFCSQSAVPTYYRFEERPSTCKNMTAGPTPKPMILTPLRPHIQKQSLQAWRCKIVKTAVHYWKNLINEPKSDPKETIVPVTYEECDRMVRFKTCSHGKLTNGATTNDPKLDYSYWSAGDTEVINCFLASTMVFVEPGFNKMNAAFADISTCRFGDGFCVQEDGSMVIWPKEATTEERFCSYLSMGTQTELYQKECGYLTTKNKPLATPKAKRECNSAARRNCCCQHKDMRLPDKIT